MRSDKVSVVNPYTRLLHAAEELHEAETPRLREGLSRFCDALAAAAKERPRPDACVTEPYRDLVTAAAGYNDALGELSDALRGSRLLLPGAVPSARELSPAEEYPWTARRRLLFRYDGRGTSPQPREPGVFLGPTLYDSWVCADEFAIFRAVDAEPITREYAARSFVSLDRKCTDLIRQRATGTCRYRGHQDAGACADCTAGAVDGFAARVRQTVGGFLGLKGRSGDVGGICTALLEPGSTAQQLAAASGPWSAADNAAFDRWLTDRARQLGDVRHRLMAMAASPFDRSQCERFSRSVGEFSAMVRRVACPAPEAPETQEAVMAGRSLYACVESDALLAAESALLCAAQAVSGGNAGSLSAPDVERLGACLGYVSDVLSGGTASVDLESVAYPDRFLNR